MSETMSHPAAGTASSDSEPTRLRTWPLALLCVLPVSTTRVHLPIAEGIWRMPRRRREQNLACVAHEMPIGYDLRVVSDSYIETWNQDRKREWLLRPDVIFPASVDDQVWPSILNADKAQRAGVWTGCVQHLWEDMSRLEEWHKKDDSLPERAWLICVSLTTTELSQRQREVWSDMLMTTHPNSVDLGWTFLGYDVADRFLTSGLCNGVHVGDQDYGELRTRFEPSINSHHLFGSLPAARQFAAVSGMRRKLLAEGLFYGHLPMYVYGVWLVRKENVL